MRAHILTIGDELLSGDVIDKNKAFLGQRCRALGIEVVRATTVRDRENEIVAAVRAAVDDAQVCLVSGGLGPTTDDLTITSIAAAAGVGLIRHAELAERLEAFFASRGREIVEANLKQADLPDGAEVLANPIGTAAGFALALDSQGSHENRCLLFSTPGVPREMHLMMEQQIEPRLRERFELAAIPRRVYRSLGTGESTVQQRVQPVIDAARARSPGLANVLVHYRARYPEVQLILEATPGADGAQATASELASLDAALIQAVGPAVYAVAPDEGPPELDTLLVRALIDRGLTIASAESCTGGGIGHALTNVPGSSATVMGGIIAYANSVKMGQLGVPAAALESHGAVSEPVARAMAEGARERLGADIGVSTTGVAGPGGGSPDKPVGTVDVAVAMANGTTYQRLRIYGRRDTVRDASIRWALKLVWDRLDVDLDTPQTPPP